MRFLTAPWLLCALVGLAAPAFGQGKSGCPVDKKPTAGSKSVVQVNRKRTLLCSPKCAAAFRKQPEKYLDKVGDCPVLHNPVAKVAADGRLVVNNQLYYFCCAGCKEGFLQSPAHLKKLEDVVTQEVFTVGDSSPRVDYQGQHYLFATADSKAAFEKNPDKYAVIFGK
jgi:YHS domain-containing protein